MSCSFNIKCTLFRSLYHYILLPLILYSLPHLPSTNITRNIRYWKKIYIEHKSLHKIQNKGFVYKISNKGLSKGILESSSFSNSKFALSSHRIAWWFRWFFLNFPNSCLKLDIFWDRLLISFLSSAFSFSSAAILSDVNCFGLLLGVTLLLGEGGDWLDVAWCWLGS